MTGNRFSVTETDTKNVVGIVTWSFDMAIYVEAAEQTRTGKTGEQDSIDILCSRVGLLAGMDKVLMTMHLRNGASIRQIARLTGMSVSKTSRKITRLSGLLLENEYLICLRNRRMFTVLEVDIARDYFLQGRSVREIAIRRKNSYYNIQKTIRKIERLIAVIKQGNPEAA